MKKIFLAIIFGFLLLPLSLAHAEDETGRTHDEGPIGGGGSGFEVTINQSGSTTVQATISRVDLDSDSDGRYLTLAPLVTLDTPRIELQILKSEFRSGGFFDLNSWRTDNLLCGSGDVRASLYIVGSRSLVPQMGNTTVTFTLTSVATEAETLHLEGSLNYSYQRGLHDVVQTAVFADLREGTFSACSTDWTLADGGSPGSASGTHLRPATDLLGTPPLHDLKTALESGKENKKDDSSRQVQGVKVEAVTVKGGKGFSCSLEESFSSTFDLGSIAVILFGLAASRIRRRRG